MIYGRMPISSASNISSFPFEQSAVSWTNTDKSLHVKLIKYFITRNSFDLNSFNTKGSEVYFGGNNKDYRISC